MPIDDLASVIETLQQRIRQHAPSLRENEIRTRIALIDPLLRALGWDVSDPALVTPEYAVSGGRVDYALLGADGKAVALLEAKHLNEALTAHRMQMVNYANMSGVPYAGLTDGNHWELYEVFAQKPFEECHLLRVSIADTPAYQCALPMLLLWLPNLASGQPTPASAPILAALPETPPSPVPPTPMPDAVPVPAPAPTAKPPPLPTPLVTPAAETQPPLGWTALSSIAWNKDMNAPQSIRFPDDSEYPIQRWRNLAVSAAQWLWSNGRLTHRNLPVPAPGRSSRYVVSTEAVHQSGQPFTTRQPIAGTPLIAEVNVGGNQAIDYARALLQHCGVNPADVFVQTSQ